MNYNEILDNINVFYDKSETELMLSRAGDEYAGIRKKIYILSRKITDKKNSKMAFAFYLGLLERFIESCLIDADRVDTADFMNGYSTELKTETEKLNNLWTTMQQNINNKLDNFSGYKDKISLQRKSISDRCFHLHRKNVEYADLLFLQAAERPSPQ